MSSQATTDQPKKETEGDPKPLVEEKTNAGQDGKVQDEDERDFISGTPPELLEMILKAVDHRTLLLSQRVSKKWRGTVEGSKILQRKLFFLPGPPDTGLPDDELQRRTNGLLCCLIPQYEAKSITLNPLLFKTPGEVMREPPRLIQAKGQRILRCSGNKRVQVDIRSEMSDARAAGNESESADDTAFGDLYLNIEFARARPEWSCFRMFMMRESDCVCDFLVFFGKSQGSSIVTVKEYNYEANSQKRLGNCTAKIVESCRTMERQGQRGRGQLEVVAVLLTEVYDKPKE